MSQRGDMGHTAAAGEASLSSDLSMSVRNGCWKFNDVDWGNVRGEPGAIGHWREPSQPFTK
jgi:hypothetical protein